MTSEHTEVNYTFKLLYAIGIFLIVAAHITANGGFSLFYEFIPPRAFHLALFMFASGYFYKEESINHIKNFILKKFKKLIIPLYLYNIFYAVLILFLRKYDLDFGCIVSLKTLLLSPITNGHQFIYNMGGWYIIPLFMVHCYNVIIRKCLKPLGNEAIFTLIAFSLGIFGIILSKDGLNQDYLLCITRMLYFIPFFQLGFLYKKFESFDTLSNTAYFGIIITLKLFIIYTHNGTIIDTPSWCIFQNGCILPFVIGILGIAFWLRVCKILTPVLGKSKIVNILADNTYTIMINQFLGFLLVKSIFAILYEYNIACFGFDYLRFKSDIFYYYVPHGLFQFNIIYIIAGLVVPIYIQKLVSFIKQKFCNLFFALRHS